MKSNHSLIYKKKKIWIDLENSPHVPFFNPIIRELEKRNYSVVITVRDCFQVCELADNIGLKYKNIGHHYGKNRFLKVVGLLIRSFQLIPTLLNTKPDLALSHGSRSQSLISNMFGIPSVELTDYECASLLIRPSVLIIPEVIPIDAFQHFKGLILKYPGLKEDVYVPDFKPDRTLIKKLGVRESDLVVTIRPPATEAHYHNAESESLYEATIDFLGQKDNVCMVILPRNEQKDMQYLKNKWSSLFETGKIIIPEHAVDGLNMIWLSDLVISGGGTMNREAAALGVPVYSIFRGKIGAVDRYLSENGRMILLETVEDVRTKILLNKRLRSDIPDNSNHQTLDTILELIETILREPR